MDYANRELLTGIQKLCTRKSCFGKNKPSEQVNAFYEESTRMLEMELNRTEAINSENAFTIVSNYLYILNASVATSKGAKSAIEFVDCDIDADAACAVLNDALHIARRERMISFIENDLMGGAFKWLSMGSVLAGAVLFGVVKYEESKTVGPTKRWWNGVIQTKAYKNQVNSSNEAIQFVEKWKPIAWGLVIVGILVGLLGVWYSMHRKQNLQIRKDYQRVSLALHDVAEELKVLEW